VQERVAVGRGSVGEDDRPAVVVETDHHAARTGTTGVATAGLEAVIGDHGRRVEPEQRDQVAAGPVTHDAPAVLRTALHDAVAGAEPDAAVLDLELDLAVENHESAWPWRACRHADENSGSSPEWRNCCREAATGPAGAGR
jgi:hypothetical protein